MGTGESGRRGVGTGESGRRGVGGGLVCVIHNVAKNFVKCNTFITP